MLSTVEHMARRVCGKVAQSGEIREKWSQNDVDVVARAPSEISATRVAAVAESVDLQSSARCSVVGGVKGGWEGNRAW